MYRKNLSLMLVLVMMLSVLVHPVTVQAQNEGTDIGGSGSGIYETQDLRFQDSDRNRLEVQEYPISSDYDNPFGAEKVGKPEAVDIESSNEVQVKSVIDEGEAGSIAYGHLNYLSEEIGQRPSDIITPESEAEGIEYEDEACRYIKDVLEDFYETEVQTFSAEVRSKKGELKGYVYSANVIAVKPGALENEVIIGAHYDSVDIDGNKGADDNASGVAIMLEVAERLANVETPYTLRFIAFGAEEVGLKGSKYYVSQMTQNEIENTVAMINLDSCIAGDKMYVYGGLAEDGWVRDLALEIAEDSGLNLETNPGLNPDYPEGTTGDWSDHAPFKDKEIPYAYFEATNWELGELDGYTQVPVEYGNDGEIWHTAYDNIAYIENNFPGRINERLDTFCRVLADMLLELGEIPATEGIEVSNNLVSMTEVREIEVSASLGYLPELANLEWTFGGIPFEEWKKWDPESNTYIGEPFVTFSTEPYLEQGIIKAKIEFGLPYDTTDLSSFARRLYPELIGYYVLQLKDISSGEALGTALRMNPYDSYCTYDELKPTIDEIFESARENRYLEYKSLGKTIEGRDAHFVILSKDEESIDRYLNEIMPTMLENPEMLIDELEEGANADYKVPIWFNNIHPDESPGPDAILELLEELAKEEEITFKLYGSYDAPVDNSGYGSNVEDPSQEEIVTLQVDEVLDNVIFLFNFTENPDGRYWNTRTNVNGFDLNRDNAYQTQVETRMTTREIAKWKPISFLDFHGFINGFLIEPCTTPHEPNYEYDLLIESMLEQAHIMGRAGTANTIYTNYEIPYEDHPGGWDDGTPSYTSSYAMFNGGLGHTVEIPDLNQHSVDALVATGLASTKYVMDNKERLFMNQLEYFRRGVEGIDSRSVDEYLLNEADEVVGRPRGEYDNFFPEYYVIPVDGSLQRNALEAYRMAQYLLRNGIRVEISNEEVEADGVTYPAGSFVIDMHQAMRGYANCVLYDSYDVSDFEAMYAEIVMAFHDIRGFDRYELRNADVFDGRTEEINEVDIPMTFIPEGVGDTIIRNTNNDAIRAVNQLLKTGNEVKLLLSDGSGYEKGDFLVSREDLISIKDNYLLDVVNYDNAAPAKGIGLPKVAASATGHLEFALDEMGFEIVSSPREGNVIVADSPASITNYLHQGKPYIGISNYGFRNITNPDLLPGLALTYTRYEGLLRGETQQGSLIASHLGEEEILYSSQGAYISSMPEEAEAISWVSDEDDFFKAGWWTTKEEVRGMPLAIRAKIDNADVTLFANNIVNKGHTQKEWRMLANAIFVSNLEE